MNKKIDCPVSQGDKRFDILLFFVGFLLLFSTFNSSFFTTEKHYNTHEVLVASGDNIELTSDLTKRADQIKTAPDIRPFFWDKIPVNEADKQLLMTIRGIGPGLAEKIIETRKSRGMFKNINDLKQIKGVGERRATYFKKVFDFGDHYEP